MTFHKTSDIIRNHQGLRDDQRGACIAMGNFDGVHRGHQAVLRQACQKAGELGVPSGVLAFDPHPRDFFQAETRRFHLCTLEQKAGILHDLGIDLVYALTFDKAMATMSADHFIEHVLVEGLGIRHLFVGYDFQFGKGREGNTDLLIARGAELGFGVTIIEAQHPDNDDRAFSSTRCRELLRDGQPRQAADQLDRWWTIEGTVQKGDQRGRTIGFPTANVAMIDYIEPRFGVYAVRVRFDDDRLVDGVVNLGMRPTFDKEDVLLEVHLFDFAEDIYDRQVAVHFVEFIRPEQKFDGLDALKEQIARDSDKARNILSDPAYAADLFPQA